MAIVARVARLVGNGEHLRGAERHGWRIGLSAPNAGVAKASAASNAGMNLRMRPLQWPVTGPIPRVQRGPRRPHCAHTGFALGFRYPASSDSLAATRLKMPITATYTPAQFKLSVLGTVDPDGIIVSRNAGGTLLVNAGAVPVTGGTATVANTSTHRGGRRRGRRHDHARRDQRRAAGGGALRRRRQRHADRRIGRRHACSARPTTTRCSARAATTCSSAASATTR